MGDKPVVIVVMPAYNAAKTLEHTYRDIPAGVVDKIVLVDDVSQDETVEIAQRLGLKVIIHIQNKGYGGNQKTCYIESLKDGADIVVMLHPDYQYDSRKIPELIAPILEGRADLVLGSRLLGGGTLAGGMPLYKYVSNRFLTIAENLVLRQHLSECHTGFRAYSRRMLETIPFLLNSEGFLFDTEVIVQAVAFGFRLAEIAVPTRYFKEASSVDFKTGVRYWARYSHGAHPIHPRPVGALAFAAVSQTVGANHQPLLSFDLDSRKQTTDFLIGQAMDPAILPVNANFKRADLAFSAFRVLVVAALLSLLVIRVAFGAPTTNHFAFLANAFLHGTFSVGTLPENYADTITSGDQVYLPMGPAPAMLAMPFVSLFGVVFDELWITLALTLFNVWVFQLILRRIGISNASRRRWLLALFFLGTIYLGTVYLGRSWFLAHIVETLFLLLAINETLQRGSSLRVGLLLGMAFLTRGSTVLALPFFVIARWDSQGWNHRLRWTIGILIGLAIPMLFFFLYNYARFGNIMDTGYARALPGSPFLQQAMRYGLFNLVHVPKNLYMLFLSVPQPVPYINSPVLTFPWILPSRWGMSIFFTTPAFLYAFLANRQNRIAQAAWVAVLAILPSLLMYYGVGYDQFGYRYAIDFYPFLFIVTALGLNRRWGRLGKALIVISILINIWGAWCAEFGAYAEPL